MVEIYFYYSLFRFQGWETAGLEAVLAIPRDLVMDHCKLVAPGAPKPRTRQCHCEVTQCHTSTAPAHPPKGLSAQSYG